MARSLSSIRSDVRQLIGQPDSANSNFTNAQIDIWINEGYRDIAQQLKVAIVKEREYTSGETITLNTGTLEVNEVLFEERDSSGTVVAWRRLRVGDESDLVSIDPDYENTDAGVPTHAFRMSQFTMRLWPKPDSNNTAKAEAVKTFGNELPTELSADSDETVFAHHLDDIISHYVAYRCFARLNEPERSVIEQRDYQRRLKLARASATDWSRRRRRFTFTESDNSGTRSLKFD